MLHSVQRPIKVQSVPNGKPDPLINSAKQASNYLGKHISYDAGYIRHAWKHFGENLPRIARLFFTEKERITRNPSNARRIQKEHFKVDGSSLQALSEIAFFDRLQNTGYFLRIADVLQRNLKGENQITMVTEPYAEALSEKKLIKREVLCFSQQFIDALNAALAEGVVCSDISIEDLFLDQRGNLKIGELPSCYCTSAITLKDLELITQSWIQTIHSIMDLASVDDETLNLCVDKNAANKPVAYLKMFLEAKKSAILQEELDLKYALQGEDQSPL